MTMPRIYRTKINQVVWKILKEMYKERTEAKKKKMKPIF